jgi:DNA-binding CsgD family transcriptional regulator
VSDPDLLLTALQQLSALLLELYAASDALPFPEFQAAALRLVQAVVPFDSALWGVGTYLPNGIPQIFAVFLLNQPQAMLADYERVKDRDQAFAAALRSPGTTVNIAAPGIAWGPGSEPMRAHIERYGMAHTLATLTRGPVTELASAICLYRADAAKPFSELERVLQQALVAHLVAGYDRSRIQYLASLQNAGRQPPQRAAAIVDSRGTLHSASPSFVNLLLSEWPEWRGPMVPRELLDAVRGERTTAPFTRIVARATPVNDLFLVNLRDIAACDHLSDREWDVARAFGDGMSHKEVAQRLGIAPGTVRNHLSSVYAKLGVTNKAELAHVLDTSPR